MRLKLTLEYDGTPFYGWAAQPGLPTVEGDTSRSARGDVRVASRTSPSRGARTRASMRSRNVVSVDVDGGPPPNAPRRRSTAACPTSVSVVSAEEAPADFSARFSARSRTYRYRIFNRRAPSPFEHRRAWWITPPLDEDAAERRARRSCSASTTSAPSRRRRRSTTSSCAPSSGRSGSAAATTSTSRSPPTATSATWCARSSGRCSSWARTSSRRSSPAAPRPRPGRPRRRGGSTSSRLPTMRIAVIRFPVVLFDLDGTVVDSGAIILASMRHATREVLGREFGDAELMQAVGGPGLEAQMAVFAPDRVDELVRVYRAHNEPLHDELEACAGMEDVLVRLHAEGRRLGIVTAKRRATVELAFARVPLAHLFETVVGGDETERHKPDPEPLLLAAERMRARSGDDRLRRRLAVRHPRGQGRGHARDRRHVGPHPRPRAARARGAGRDRRHRRRSCLSISEARARAAELRDLLNRALIAYHVEDDPVMTDAAYDALYDELAALEARASGARHARLADAARRRAAVGEVPEGAAPRADGLARQGDDRRGAREVGRRHPQAARHRRARRVRARAEDRRLRDQPPLRERPLHARRDARRRRAGRGRDAEPPHDRRNTPADAGQKPAAGARGARRGVHAAGGLPRVQRAARRGRKGAGAEPAQRRRGLAATEGSEHHRAAAALDLGLRHRPSRGPRPARVALGDARSGCASAASARTRSPSASSRSTRSPSAAARGSSGARSSTTRSTAS